MSQSIEHGGHGASPRWLRGAIAGLFVLITLLRVFGVVFPAAWEWSMYDIAARHIVPSAPATDQVVVIDVDDVTLEELQEQWPLSRATWAKFLCRLHGYGPAVIALDMVFDQPSNQSALDFGERLRDYVVDHHADPDSQLTRYMDEELAQLDHDRQLSEAIAEAGVVVLGSILPVPEAPDAGWLTPLPVVPSAVRALQDTPISSMAPIAMSARATGLLNVIVEWDGVVRRYPYITDWRGKQYQSIALAAVTNAYPERAQELTERVASLDHGAPLLRFPGEIRLARFSDVLFAPPDSPAITALRDRIVIVGVTAVGLQEQLTTPIRTAVPGVEIHGMAAMNLLSASHYQSAGAPAWFGFALTLFVLGIVILACERLSMSWLSGVALGICILHLALMYVLLVTVGWLVAFLPVAGGAIAVAGTEVLFRVQYLRRHRRKVLEQERLNEAKSEFLSVISHELRTPLTSIRGSLGLVANGAMGKLPDPAADLIDIAHTNTERLIRLVNNILDLQKISTGKMEFRFEEIELAPLLERIVKETRPYGDQLGVTIDLDCTQTIYIRADRDLLTQAVTNLLSNAIKFSPKGESVRMDTTPGDAMVRIAVHDHGPGIAKEFHDRLFARFVQIESSSKHPKGSGLGLHIVKTIIEQHDGQVGFDSEVGVGSTFYVDLPVIEGPTPEPADDDNNHARAEQAH